MILVFWPQARDTQFQGEPLRLGLKIHRGGKNLRFSTEIAVYLGNDTRYSPGAQKHLFHISSTKG